MILYVACLFALAVNACIELNCDNGYVGLYVSATSNSASTVLWSVVPVTDFGKTAPVREAVLNGTSLTETAGCVPCDVQYYFKAVNEDLTENLNFSYAFSTFSDGSPDTTEETNLVNNTAFMYKTIKTVDCMCNSGEGRLRLIVEHPFEGTRQNQLTIVERLSSLVHGEDRVITTQTLNSDRGFCVPEDPFVGVTAYDCAFPNNRCEGSPKVSVFFNRNQNPENVFTSEDSITLFAVELQR